MEEPIDHPHQVQDSAEQSQTPWQRIYEEYKRNTASLKEKYSHELNREIISKQSKDTYSLANIFKNIANENINLAGAVDTNQSLKLYHYNDAAIACQYTLKLTNDQKVQQDTYKILDTIQTAMVRFSGGDANKVKPLKSKEDIEILSNRKELQDIRDQTSTCLEKIEKHRISKKDELYINESAQVFKDIACGMQRYLEALYKSGENILGVPPCDYTVIGLGSMALRQMTPYSDLECAILTANEDKQHDNPAATRNYFINLSHLVHFKIINLGETIIPTSAYNINLSEFVSPAVNFDLGGKTPLGRIEKDKPYELIQTVGGMRSYLENSNETTDHIDKNLSSILQKVCFIYGSEELAKSYQEEAQEFLSDESGNGRPNYEDRAIKALSEGVEEIDYTKSTLQPKKIEGNLEQFSLNANKAQGKLFDVKQEIYRMPDRFIYNLGLIYGIQEDSSWDTIDKLCEKGIIHSKGASNLKKALSFATNLRLKTYFKYGHQKDSMDFAKTYEVQSDLLSQKVEQELSKVFKLPLKELEEGGALFEYYYTALALRNSLEAFCKLDDDQKEGFFSNNLFYQTDVGTKAQINLRLLRYEDALKYQLKELEELKIKKQDLIDNHSSLTQIDLEIATSLNNIGCACEVLGKYKKALKFHKEALEIKEKLSKNHPDIATSYDNIGGTYEDLGEYKKALEYYISVAVSLSNIGCGYEALKKHQKALEYHTKGLERWSKLSKNYYPDVANSYDNIGGTCRASGKYQKALEYQIKALKIRLTIYANSPHHLDIATSYNNIGGTYEDLGEQENALKFHKRALKIWQESLGDGHPDVAISLNNIGLIYNDLRNHQKALKFHKEALKIRRKSLTDNHPAVAKSLDNIGSTYTDLGDYQKALEYQIKALETWKKSLGEDHPDVATSFNNIGATYGDLGDHQKALGHETQALNIFQKSLGHNHVDTIACKYNVSQEYCHLGMYKEALAELAGILAVYSKTKQQDKINQCKDQINYIKRIKGLYEDSNKLLEDNTIVSGKSYNETAKVANNLTTALNQFKECNNFKKSDVIDEKILQTLDLLIKAQTYLCWKNKTNSKKGDVYQLDIYKTQHKDLKKSIEDKQLKLQEIEEYLAEQKQGREEQNENVPLADKTLSIIETNSSSEEVPENIELVSLTGENNNEDMALNLN